MNNATRILVPASVIHGIGVQQSYVDPGYQFLSAGDGRHGYWSDAKLLQGTYHRLCRKQTVVHVPSHQYTAIFPNTGMVTTYSTRSLTNSSRASRRRPVYIIQ